MSSGSVDPEHPPGGGTARVVPARVVPAGRLRGELLLPGDKSIGHRALLLAAMGAGEATIAIRRPGADVRSTAGAVAALGALVGVEAGPDGERHYTVRGGGTPDAARLPGDGGEAIDCGNAGTGMRLLAGALAGRPGTVTLHGDASLSGRPMERVAGPLRAMGAAVDTTDGHAPLRITGTRPLRAMDHTLPVASAQVLGAVTLAAVAADGRTTIEVPGPTRDHTERMLGWLGAAVRRDGTRTQVDGPTGFVSRSLHVPGDPSSAAFWLAAAAIHPDAELLLRDVALNPSRLAIVDVLREMGADIEVHAALDGPGTGIAGAAAAGPEPTGDLLVRGGRPLRAIQLAGHRVAELIDELPLLGVVMAAADGTSELHDAAELRVKESDRIALVVAGLRAIGADAQELPDGWRVRRGQPREATIATAGDHRIAMAFAIAGLVGVATGVAVDDPDCADVSYPGFWSDLERVSNAALVSSAS